MNFFGQFNSLPVVDVSSGLDDLVGLLLELGSVECLTLGLSLGFLVSSYLSALCGVAIDVSLLTELSSRVPGLAVFVS